MYTVVVGVVTSRGTVILTPGYSSHRNQSALALNAHASKATPSLFMVDTECPPICLYSNKQTLI